MAGRDRTGRLSVAVSGGDVAASPDDHQLLRTYVQLNILTLLLAGVALAPLRIWVIPNDWIEVLLILLGALAACLARAIRQLDGKRYVSAVATIAVANWTMIVVFTGLVPFAALILPLMILTPCLLALPFVTPFQFSVLAGGAVLTGALTMAVGRLQGGVGLEAMAPIRVLDAFVIVFIPISAGLILRLAWQSHASLVARTNALSDAGVRILLAGDRERRRIERALHDGALQRLGSASVRLGRLLASLEHLPLGEQQLEDVIEDLQEASGELRVLSHGIYPPQLSEAGLVAAVTAAAQRSRVQSSVQANGIIRYPAEVEASVYFCCLAVLRSADQRDGDGGTKNGTVALLLDGGEHLLLRIHDSTYRDVAATAMDSVLTDISDRLLALGGALDVDIRPEDGMHLAARIPGTALGAGPPAASATPLRMVGAAILRRLWSVTARAAFGSRASPDHARPLPEDSLTTYRMIAAQVMPIVSMVFVSASFYAFTGSTRALLAGSVNVAALGAVTGALVLVRRARRGAAVVVVAGTLWSWSLTMTALFPVLLYHVPCIMVLPVLLSVPTVRNSFKASVLFTIATTVGVVLLGRTHPFGSGLPPATPPWVVNLGVIAFVTLSLAICVFVMSVQHATLSERTEALQQARRRMVIAMNVERRRIERDLHDGAQQQLVAAAVQLRVAQRLLRAHPVRAQNTLRSVMDSLRSAEDDLKDLSSGVYPPQLGQEGLHTALCAAARRSPLPVTVDAQGIPRYPSDVEIGIYFCCLEALQNAAKHAGANATVVITLREHDGLVLDVRDTGVGMSPGVLTAGHGLMNIRDRLSAMGGTLSIGNAFESGFHLHARVPAPHGDLSAASSNSRNHRTF